MLRALLVLVSLATPLAAQDRAAIERQFDTWLAEEIWPEARDAGISRATFEAAFDGVDLDWGLPDLVPPGAAEPRDRPQSQAEFGAPGAYFRAGVVEAGTRVGREMAGLHAATLARIEEQSGVPAHILLAIWGRESAYGRAAIPEDAFAVLGTKAFMSTRRDVFRAELLAALRIAQDGPVRPRDMRSSWAGALGQPQFMPTSYLDHAADGDGDGRADIWTSAADTLASIAAYLVHHGWHPERDWGFEVDLPAQIACTMAGPDQARSIAEWTRLGVTRVSGRAFPAHERDGPASLLLPAGIHGPAFLVTPNFYVLKDYNTSDLYALFVGHVGDRIAYGMGDFARPWLPVDTLYRSDIARFQRGLEAQGFDVGGADGLVGFRTRRAIGQWQEAQGQRPTCFPDAAMLR